MLRLVATCADASGHNCIEFSMTDNYYVLSQLAIVVPIRGRSQLVNRSLSSIVAACRNAGGVQLVLVDNNEVDDSPDPEIYRYKDEATIVRSLANNVGGVRNAGVKAVREAVALVAFVDSDCVVKPSFCWDVLRAFSAPSSPAAVGCKVLSPVDGHWTEIAGDTLHRQGGDGPRLHLNSGCLAVRREIFTKLGGFSEALPANEDYDLCGRIRAAGGKIWQFESLAVVHLGNPKTLAGCFRRLRWHGRGALNADGRVEWSPMAVATLCNSLTLLFAVILAGSFVSRGRFLLPIGILILGVLLVPVAFWGLRMLQFKRWIVPWGAIALMQITFLARQFGMLDQWKMVRMKKRDPNTQVA